MKLKHYLEQAYWYFLTAKLRAFLAMLGILVGTASIVALMSAGRLATEAALAQFKTMGTDLLSITLYQQPSKNQPLTSTHNTAIPLNTWEQFPALVPAVLDIAPYSTLYQTISYDGRILNNPIVGANEALARMLHLHLATGHFVSSFASYEHQCVIGNQLAQQLQQFKYGKIIGRQLKIGETLYTIIGVLKPWKENTFFNQDMNQALIIPIKGITLINPTAQINHAILRLHPKISIDDIVTSIQQTIKKQAPRQHAFIRSAKQIIEGMENQGHIFTLLLATIGSISLLVGGIGIMNIMLVSIHERKQEIGIRKALGATRQQIHYLFLTEAFFLSFVGGILGVVLGIGATWIIAKINHWQFTLYFMPPILGFFVSVATGLFFGLYPAHRAARLDPVVSLKGIS
jgi:putative ABC transport system permease protein